MYTKLYIYTPGDQDYLNNSGGSRINYYYEKIAAASRANFNSYTAWVQVVYESGKSLRETGRIVVMSNNGVAMMLRNLGVKLRPRGGANHKGRRL